jgi:hypothetical protein
VLSTSEKHPPGKPGIGRVVGCEGFNVHARHGALRCQGHQAAQHIRDKCAVRWINRMPAQNPYMGFYAQFAGFYRAKLVGADLF